MSRKGAAMICSECGQEIPETPWEPGFWTIQEWRDDNHPMPGPGNGSMLDPGNGSIEIRRPKKLEAQEPPSDQ